MATRKKSPTRHRLQVKRVYDPPDADDGARLLVDRLWPRGLTKEKAAVDAWVKEVAPSDELRKTFHGHPERFDAFVAAYRKELGAPDARAAAESILERLADGPVTLLFASRELEQNNATVLAAWLAALHRRRTKPKPKPAKIKAKSAPRRG